MTTEEWKKDEEFISWLMDIHSLSHESVLDRAHVTQAVWESWSAGRAVADGLPGGGLLIDMTSDRNELRARVEVLEAGDAYAIQVLSKHATHQYDNGELMDLVRDVTQRVVELQQAARIRPMDDSQPVGQWVWTLHRTTTDPDGRYIHSHMPSGWIPIQPDQDGKCGDDD